LKKIVTIYAYDINDPGKDIGALVRIKDTGISGTTPFRAALSADEYTYTFVVSKEPRYRVMEITKNISSAGGSISIQMDIKFPFYKVIIKDVKTGKGVFAANVWIDGVLWKR